jgi:hypothetical protein
MKMKTANGRGILWLAKNLRRSGSEPGGRKEGGGSTLTGADQEIAAALLR